MATPPTSKNTTPSTGSLYKRWVTPLLEQDEGADAEQLSRLTLTALGMAVAGRHWPLVSGSLAGLGAELQTARRAPGADPVRLPLCQPGGAGGRLQTRTPWPPASGIYFGFGFGRAGHGHLACQPGNPRPRLFRLAAERAALNRMGLQQTTGAEA